MKFLKAMLMMSCSALLLASVSPAASADGWNKLTYFTFSTPIEVPASHGARVLPAGTYTFKLLDSISDRDIVQIFNKKQTHLYATVLAIPDYRMNPTSKSIITFEERAADSPQAIKTWFYPGDLFGQEFVYPRTRALELAKMTNEAVLSMPDSTAANMDKTIKTGKEPAAVALEKAPIRGEEPSGQ